MLDFDFISRRKKPSVAGMIYPFSGDHVQRFYWGTKEILVPVYSSVEHGCKTHPDVDWVINFASCRSVSDTCQEILQNCPQIKNIAIIAEGVPERFSKRLRDLAQTKGVNVIGPATGTQVRVPTICNVLHSRRYSRGSLQDW